MRADPKFPERILDELEVAGVERWDDSAVVIRARFRVAPLEQWTVKREYLKRLKRAFDEEGIDIPFPQMRLHTLPAAEAKATAVQKAPALAH